MSSSKKKNFEKYLVKSKIIANLHPQTPKQPPSMKRTASIFPTIVIPCLLMALSPGAYAYHPSVLSSHIPRDGDRLHPNVSLSPGAIAAVDSVRRSVSLNPELFAPMDEADVSVYVDGDTLSYVQFATRHIFVISRDTLS